MIVIKGFLWNISQILPLCALQKQQIHQILKHLLVLYFTCSYCATSVSFSSLHYSFSFCNHYCPVTNSVTFYLDVTLRTTYMWPVDFPGDLLWHSYIIQDYLRVESFHLLSAAALAFIEAMPDLLFKFIYHCAAKRVAG